MFGIAAALGSAAAAWAVERHRHLATLTPAERASFLAREQRREEDRALEAAAEVKLARECIAREGLAGDGAESLLNFARELARRRDAKMTF